MQFDCVAEFEFTRDLSEAKKEVDAALELANKTIMRKGAKDAREAAQASDWRLSADGKRLTVRIESGAVVRAHAALIRLRNFLNEQLGAKLKVGIRGVEIKKFEVKGIELKQAALRPIEISCFVEEVKASEDGLKASLKLKDLTPALIEGGAVDRIIKLVQDKVEAQHYEGKSEVKKLLWASDQKTPHYDKDPAVELEARNWIRRTKGKAQFVFGPQFASLANAFKELLAEQVYAKLGFREMIFPKFEPWDVPARSGHAKNIYPEAFFVAVPKKSDPAAWEKEKDFFRITGEVLKTNFAEKLDFVGIMSYAQCPPFWRFLEGRVVLDESLPIRVFDWSGPTYRNEAGGTQGIARLEEFHRIETLWVGTPAQTKKITSELADAFTVFFNKTLDLEFRKNWITPWFLAQEGKLGLSEKASEGVGTTDFDAWLPYRGPREKSEWLEFQNVSNNGDKYPKAFSVKAQSSELWSGCAGGSLERWACAFLAQKGFDKKNWPSAVRDRVDITGEVKFA
ncbi:MAG: aminoacyl--tRNA ligase-related protein [Candidatus Norongarragalinales archaeon]